MERYRVNYPLLAKLVIGFVVAAPALYFFWKFQVNRNASRLLEEATYAQEKGDSERAFDALSQYVKLRSGDANGQLRLGQSAVTLLKRDDLNIETRSKAYFAAVEAVLRARDVNAEWTGSESEKQTAQQELFKLRRDVVELHMRYGYLDRALTGIDELIKDGQEDSELDALKAQSLYASQQMGDFARWAYELIGYNQKTKEFDLKPRAGDQPIVYHLLVRYLLSIKDQELADRIIEQMVAANPESLEAFAFQYHLLKVRQKDDEAREALAKAFALDPTNAAVLQGKGAEAIADYETAMKKAGEEGADADALRKEAEAHLEAASEYLTQGIEKYPERIDFYLQASRIETFRQKYDEALAIADKGLKQFSMEKFLNALSIPVAIDLESQKIDILFVKQDLDGIRSEIKLLRGLNNPTVDPLADYYETRLELNNENYLEAARRFNQIKSRLMHWPGLQAWASTYQALCHKQLGQQDLALEAANYALQKNPQLPMALTIKSDIEGAMGLQSKDDTVLQFDHVLRQQAQLPPAQQNWDLVEQQIEELVRVQAEAQGRDEKWVECRVQLLSAQMYVTRATFVEDEGKKEALFQMARDAVTNAHRLDPNDVTIQLAAPRVLMLEPKSGPAKALQLLDGIIARNKSKGIEETQPFRALRIEILFALRDEQIASQLRAATEGIEDWHPSRQAEIYAAVASRFEQLRQPQDAEIYYREAAKLAPTLLQYRVALFELARQQADDNAMREAQKGLLEVVKSTDDPDYVLTEVKRLMVGYATESITDNELRKARTILEDAIRRRQNWPEAYILSAQLALMLENDPGLAITKLNQALEYGPNNLNALNLQIRLLADQRRFDVARKVMDRLPETSWTAILDRTAAEVLRSVGETDRAFDEAKKLVDANANDPQMQLWFAGIATAAKKFDAAEAAYQAAIGVEPNNPDIWSALLNYYIIRKQGPKVETTLRRAQLALDEEYATLLTAQQHRLAGRFPQAESIFLASWEDQQDQLPVAQRMAEFYLAWGEHFPIYRDKAAPFLNRILRAGYEGEAPPNDPAVAWARQQAARVFSLSGDYRDSLKAERMLASAVEKNVAAPEAQDMLVDILNRRGDPASRMRAVELLKQIQKQRGLQPAYELLLGQALAGIGELSQAERQFREAIARHPDDLALRVGLIEYYIDRKDADSADSWLTRLAGVEGGPATIPQLRIRLASASDDKTAVRQQLMAITPNLRAVRPDQLRLVYSIALLAESVGDHQYALELLKFVADHEPGHELELARATALYGDLDQGLAMLRSLFDENKDQVLTVAVEVLRARRKEAPEKVDEAVDLMVRLAVRDDPEAARRMILQAEGLEVQQKFDEAIAAYKRILARDDVPDYVRASANNNLSFLLAMMKQDLDEALAGANEAIEILGPISDILDTRALVYFHRGEFDKAVEDLQMAVTVNATASKYFHLAEALLAAGDREGALEAWSEAQSRGISIETTPVVEQGDLEQFMQKIQVLGAPAA